MTVRGELARVTGFPRPEAGRGNRALVAEGFATMLSPGVYRLAEERWANPARAIDVGEDGDNGPSFTHGDTETRRN